MGTLESLIADLRRLGDGFEAEVAREVAPRLEQALRASADAGQTPEGQAWAPTKAGGRAMVSAAAHVAAKAFGDVVRVTLRGPDVFHHFSKKKGEPRRRVIPDAGELPPVVVRALEEGAAAVWALLTGRAQ